jgi:hypothetical protein
MASIALSSPIYVLNIAVKFPLSYRDDLVGSRAYQIRVCLANCLDSDVDQIGF